MTLTPELKTKYNELFITMEIHFSKEDVIYRVVKKILQNKGEYIRVCEELGLTNTKEFSAQPWMFIAITHTLECSGDFKKHLHNGDPLTNRTVRVPAGRPVEGEPPFTWIESAVDAIRYMNIDKWRDWSVSGILYLLEKYNGFGYRRYNINTPYLWSFTNHYAKGKFIVDGKFDRNFVSKQIGAAVLLRRLM